MRTYYIDIPKECDFCNKPATRFVIFKFGFIVRYEYFVCKVCKEHTEKAELEARKRYD
jgi:hypothetical protein